MTVFSLSWFCLSLKSQCLGLVLALCRIDAITVKFRRLLQMGPKSQNCRKCHPRDDRHFPTGSGLVK